MEETVSREKTKTLTLTEEQVLAVELAIINREQAAASEANREDNDEYLQVLAARAVDVYREVRQVIKAAKWHDTTGPNNTDAA